MAANSSSQRIHKVRHFNRFYTRQIGLLQEHLLQSPFSLTEGRILYDLAHTESTTATELGNALGLDAGYLSRTLRAFQKRGLITKQTSKTDGRQSLLRLTDKGHAAFAKLNAQSQTEIGAMLSKLPLADQNHLVDSMQTIETLLSEQPVRETPYILRPHRPGDMGWVVSRHGALYAQEYDWDETFEALVAEIVSQFLKNYDPKYERCWIAERNGENVGSVFIVRRSDTVAKLRLLIVDPSARGLGLGRRLVDGCIQFARQVGYQKLTLWTNSILTAARHIYQSVGFKLIEQEPQPNFGQDLISETWELDLRPAPVTIS